MFLLKSIRFLMDLKQKKQQQKVMFYTSLNMFKIILSQCQEGSHGAGTIAVGRVFASMQTNRVSILGIPDGPQACQSNLRKTGCGTKTK